MCYDMPLGMCLHIPISTTNFFVCSLVVFVDRNGVWRQLRLPVRLPDYQFTKVGLFQLKSLKLKTIVTNVRGFKFIYNFKKIFFFTSSLNSNMQDLTMIKI